MPPSPPKPPGSREELSVRLDRLRQALEGERVLGDDEADALRETYGELLDEYRDREADFDRIRELGRLIEEATESGRIPRALIRRAPR